ncbi:hypothetical protein TNCV_2508881 [Trichonephila clavipes]|nr:hypothetical protein TNCV_2508881 [Trichonephila clavipes]
MSFHRFKPRTLFAYVIGCLNSQGYVSHILRPMAMPLSFRSRRRLILTRQWKVCVLRLFRYRSSTATIASTIRTEVPAFIQNIVAGTELPLVVLRGILIARLYNDILMPVALPMPEITTMLIVMDQSIKKPNFGYHETAF